MSLCQHKNEICCVCYKDNFFFFPYTCLLFRFRCKTGSGFGLNHSGYTTLMTTVTKWSLRFVPHDDLFMFVLCIPLLVLLQNGIFAMAGSQNGFSACKLFLHKKTNIIQKMNFHLLNIEQPWSKIIIWRTSWIMQTPFCVAAVAKSTVR